MHYPSSFRYRVLNEAACLPIECGIGSIFAAYFTYCLLDRPVIPEVVSKRFETTSVVSFAALVFFRAEAP